VRVRIVAAVALIAGGIATPPSVGSPRVRPTGFPLVWRAADSTLVGFQQTLAARHIHSVWDLRSDTGSMKAFMYTLSREPFKAARKPAACGGLRYTGRDVRETLGHVGDGWFGLTGDTQGTLHLTITRRIAIYRGPGPPICVEERGTFEGETGVVSDFRGTFRMLNADTLVFTSA
jgi:hypothetical protein